MDEFVDRHRNLAVVEESVQHANGLKPKIRYLPGSHNREGQLTPF
ncbi:MAG: hypothetical protein AVDCRST_MAG78-3032 [uncultured Rubrobacteraceae bacterium]|uniref:Uncharacterized protein n=1 Tax=uncultured Rubrobacteraceae bacterium TaxID=349277 RepID=A0A6J4QKQ5_9ACTN|nr:MAG: hypothetical protein AVDCRST_MAG78-3032 [uncultured Rubrobacteraceae bacterium]